MAQGCVIKPYKCTLPNIQIIRMLNNKFVHSYLIFVINRVVGNIPNHFISVCIVFLKFFYVLIQGDSLQRSRSAINVQFKLTEDVSNKNYVNLRF